MNKCINHPLVSIVMAGYNSQIKMLKKSFDSICSQTLNNFEVIFVDDGCSEESIEFIREYGNKISLTIIHNDTNLGLPKSLNRGIQVAKGKYIARLDDDDEMLPTRLKKQVEFMDENNDYAGCWTEFVYIDDEENEVSRSHIKRINYIKQFVTKGNCCCHSSLFVKKEVLDEIGGYNEKFLYSQDLELYFRILQKYEMGCVEDYLVRFRINTTRNPIDKKILAFVFSFAAVLKYSYHSKSFKVKCYMIVRFMVLFKFAFFDLKKLKDE